MKEIVNRILDVIMYLIPFFEKAGQGGERSALSYYL